jgi:hypothetical protein
MVTFFFDKIREVPWLPYRRRRRSLVRLAPPLFLYFLLRPFRKGKKV